MLFYLLFKKYRQGTSLVVQWLGRYIPLQGIQIRSLIREVRALTLTPSKKKKKVSGDFAGGPLHWLNSELPMQGSQVQFLFRELGSHMLFGMTKKILDRKKYKQTCMLIQACTKKKSESVSCSIVFNSL